MLEACEGAIGGFWRWPGGVWRERKTTTRDDAETSCTPVLVTLLEKGVNVDVQCMNRLIQGASQLILTRVSVFVHWRLLCLSLV